jgi:hypothetical protein
MSWRQHMMVLVLAAILLAVVLATAARPETSAISTAQVELRIEHPSPEALLVSASNVTSRAKTRLQPSRATPSYEISTTRNHGAVWDQGPAYDITRTSQASIYIFFTP